MDNIQHLQQPQVDVLASSGSIRSVTVERAPGEGWAVRMRVGMSEAVVASQHRPVRIWRSLDSVGRWMDQRGIARWEVHAA